MSKENEFLQNNYSIMKIKDNNLARDKMYKNKQ